VPDDVSGGYDEAIKRYYDSQHSLMAEENKVKEMMLNRSDYIKDPAQLEQNRPSDFIRVSK